MRPTIYIMIILAFLLQGCNTSKYSNTPTGVVEKLFDAMSENDVNTYLDTIYPPDRDEPGFFYYRNIVQGLWGATGLGDLNAANVSISFTNMNYTEVYRDGNGSVAIVNVTGAIRDLNLGLEDNFTTDIVAVRLHRSEPWYVSISVQPNAILPETSTTITNSDRWSAYITNILEGDAAIDFIYSRTDNFFLEISQERGWKVISFEIIYQANETFPDPLTVWDRTTITDSTGEIRELITGGIIEYAGCGTEDIGNFTLPIGWQMRGWAWTKIPETADLAFVNIEILDVNPFLSAREPNIIQSFTVNTLYSDEYTPSNISNIPVLGSDSEIRINNYRGLANFTFTNPRLIQYPESNNATYLTIDVQVENLSNNNITSITFDEIGYYSSSNAGNYRRSSQTNLNLLSLEDYIIPPGFTDNVTLDILICSDQYEASERIWVIGQMQGENTNSERIEPAFFQTRLDIAG